MTDADSDSWVRRRTVLRAAGTGLAAATLGAGVSGSAVAQSGGPDYGDWFSDVGNFDGTVDMTGQSEVTVEVGVDANGGPYGFGPAAVRIDPGTKVVFDWVSDTHNVLPEEQPSGAGWEGHEPIENTGFSYEHTFETEGVYTYYCQPHRALGMKAAIVVGDVGGSGGGGGGGGGESGGGGSGEGGELELTPMLTMVGTGLVVAVLSPFVFGVALWRRYRRQAPEVGYRGPSAKEREEAEEELYAEEAPETEPAVELGHHDFDPIGTATAIVIYFAILVLMWVFIYFVEFLGRGPTVIG